MTYEDQFYSANENDVELHFNKHALTEVKNSDKYYEKYEKTLMFLCFLNEHDATGHGIQFINDNRIIFMNQKYTDKMKEEMKEYWSNPISQIEGKLKCHGFKVIRKGIKLTICHRINGRENPVSDDNDIFFSSRLVDALHLRPNLKFKNNLITFSNLVFSQTLNVVNKLSELIINILFKSKSSINFIISSALKPNINIKHNIDPAEVP
jgi:hypothetical protein